MATFPPERARSGSVPGLRRDVRGNDRILDRALAANGQLASRMTVHLAVDSIEGYLRADFRLVGGVRPLASSLENAIEKQLA